LLVVLEQTTTCKRSNQLEDREEAGRMKETGGQKKEKMQEEKKFMRKSMESTWARTSRLHQDRVAAQENNKDTVESPFIKGKKN